MRSFFELVGFEYKKIFKRKSTIISLILVLIVVIVSSIVSVTSNQYYHSAGGTSAYKAMELDREVISSKAGYIDDAIVKEAIEQNAIMIANDENYLINDYGRHLKSDAYIKYVLPYEKIVRIINNVYEVNTDNLSTDGFQVFNTSNIKPIDTITPPSADGFHKKITQSITEYISNIPELSQNEKEKHFAMLSQIEMPFYNDHNDGYVDFDMLFQAIALILMIATTICISPIFANEYQLKTDQVLLTSKYGKNKAVFAKLFTGISFSAAVTVVTLFFFLFSMLILHGFSGADMAIQMQDFFSTYPVTMLQSSLILIVVAVFVALLFTMFTMLLSAYFKSPFLVIIISFLTLFLPGLIYVSPKNRIVYQLLQLFPAKATSFSNIFCEYLFELFGTVFTPPVFYVGFSIIGSLLIFPFAYRTFKNHQIG